MLRVEHIALDCACRADFACNDAWFIMLTRTSCICSINGSDAKFPPDCMVLYKPGQIGSFYTCDDSNRIDYLCFNTQEDYFSNISIPFGTPIAIEDPAYYHNLFWLIAAEHASNGVLKDVIIDKLLHVLFSKLFQRPELKPQTHLRKSIYDLKRDICSRPDEHWSLKQMADMLNISIGHLESTYKNTFGVSCMEDVIINRITMAKKYLQNSTCSIAEVISRCGYRSAEHFYRQFKKVTGTTPSEYRAKTQRMDEKIQAQPIIFNGETDFKSRSS